ncbi:hypothetical protein BET23_000675 [Salmonella enterica subsp. enterica serovar Virginia]|nr:hypothetical protein [Salmonella enterica]EDN4628881.1 hypothetical protein [Salmonella enterica subsp. enterica serovar Virginia]EBE7089397.1 hypothetical protein [Salmonella enterica]EBF4478521.1 hypothetical protein [Salmonella enterica]EFV0456621.1 hypothetical protein [Salmonella enterica]
MEITKEFDIFTGSHVTVSLSDNTDSPVAFFDPSFSEVQNLSQFPKLTLSNSVETLETYDSEYTSKLSGNRKLENTTLVLNKVIDDPHQAMLEKAVENKTLLRFRLFYVIDSGYSLANTGYYQIFEGYVTAVKQRGGTDKIATVEYRIEPDGAILDQGIATEGSILRVGDFGIGAGTDTFTGPIDSELLTGNRFVTYKGANGSNPFSTDTALIHLQPNEESGWQLTCTPTGEPRLRVRTVQENGSSEWTKIYTAFEKPTPHEIGAVSQEDRIDFGEY